MTKIINSFPGYEFKHIADDNKPHNMYRDVDVGMGGYVYSEPGMYTNVALLDVASMHPHSIIALNYLGEYTQRFKDLIDVRIAIKHKDFEKARSMFDGKLAKYLDSEENADMLSKALKLPINGSYGLTAANFDNPFRDIRNKNNIVALRGALFMKTLQDEVQKRGFTVCHIKTDSIKVPNATPEIIQYIMDFGKDYGYTFEHEATYDRMCLVNDAVYIARYKDGKHAGEWTATGTQFAIPYVFKTLFSKEPVEFDDLCEAKQVKTALYLDMNEQLQPDEHDYRFVGKVGLFCPIKPGRGGGDLLREGSDANGNIKYSYATGSKGFRWLEAEKVRDLKKEKDIDISYYNKLVDDAIDTISKYGDYEWFISGDPVKQIKEPPWFSECGRESCVGCSNFRDTEQGLVCEKGHDISDLKILNDKGE